MRTVRAGKGPEIKKVAGERGKWFRKLVLERSPQGARPQRGRRLPSSGAGPGGGGPEEREPSAHLGLNPDRTSLLAAASASRVPGGVGHRRREGGYRASSRLSFVPNSLNVASYVNIC